MSNRSLLALLIAICIQGREILTAFFYKNQKSQIAYHKARPSILLITYICIIIKSKTSGTHKNQCLWKYEKKLHSRFIFFTFVKPN